MRMFSLIKTIESRKSYENNTNRFFFVDFTGNIISVINNPSRIMKCLMIKFITVVKHQS